MRLEVLNIVSINTVVFRNVMAFVWYIDTNISLKSATSVSMVLPRAISDKNK